MGRSRRGASAAAYRFDRDGDMVPAYRSRASSPHARCPPMLCTALCTTAVLSRRRCGQRCAQPVDRNGFAKTLAGQPNRPLEISHALRSEGSGRGNPDRLEDQGTGQPDNGGPPRPGSPGGVPRPPGPGFAGDAAKELRDRRPDRTDPVHRPAGASGSHRRSGHDPVRRERARSTRGRVLAGSSGRELHQLVSPVAASVAAGPAAGATPTSVDAGTATVGRTAASAARRPARGDPPATGWPEAVKAPQRAPRTHTSRGPHLVRAGMARTHRRHEPQHSLGPCPRT